MTAVATLWGPATIGQANVANGALTATPLNNSTNAVGWSLSLPKDGSITDVGFYIVAENGTSPAFNVGLTTLDTSGRPTTSAYGGSAITSAQWTTTGWKWVTLSTPATAAAGDFAAVHIYPGGSPPDGSNNITVIASTGIVAVNHGVTQNFSGSWAGTAGQPPMAVKYSGGEIYGFAFSTNTTFLTVRSNTTPDEVGCLFSVPANMTCCGAKLYALNIGWGAAATADIVLYDASSNVLASNTISDKDFVDDSTPVSVFWDSVNLTANTNYRLIVKPTTAATGDIIVAKWAFESTAAMAYVPCGTTWQWTQRTDAGAWSETNTAITPLGLWISDITFIAGSGSGGTEWGFVG
jgi:hypothetical protein